MTDCRVTPDERFHQIAGILASGVLRLGTKPVAGPQKTIKSPKKALDVAAQKPLHVLVG